MKLLWWDISKTNKGIEVVSLKEQQRIAKGLQYVTDDSVKFGIDGVWQKLAFEMSENREVYSDRVVIHRQYWYYYWDDFFKYWSRACGSGEHFEEARQ